MADIFDEIEKTQDSQKPWEVFDEIELDQMVAGSSGYADTPLTPQLAEKQDSSRRGLGGFVTDTKKNISSGIGNVVESFGHTGKMMADRIERPSARMNRFELISV